MPRRKGEIYFHRKGEYVRESLGSEKGCKKGEYRIKDLGNGRKLLLCIRKKKGPEGGKTKAVALLRDKDIDLRTVENKKVRKAAKKLRELNKESSETNLIRLALKSLTVSLRLQHESSGNRSRSS